MTPFLQKLDAHLSEGVINYHPCEEVESIQSDARVNGSLRTTERKLLKTRFRTTDKSDRATVDSVLDNRTRTVSHFLTLSHTTVSDPA